MPIACSGSSPAGTRHEYGVGQPGRSAVDRPDLMVVLGGAMKQVYSFQPSWATRLGVALALVLALTVGTLLAFVFFAVAAAGTVVWGGWLWWQIRRLRRQAESEFIHADYTVETEYELLEDHSRRNAGSKR